ncbi:hypothetical protein M413DRAFT_439424 [Hebeloma cylindrosporum]|uniref:Conserved oligomeric Golgi complex subunit 1 n=1 Tax=Hebeloma cylindrosporum TaxID=76867 RepID=A0A0C3CV86_HEBCY|nr:hypothetical protein M413DRAFT_439424 [Hebeloma cylindrosporum h7]
MQSRKNSGLWWGAFIPLMDALCRGLNRKDRERYRDLLQASSSIISIAKSSQRILNALEESKEAIQSQHALPLPQKPDIMTGRDDRHLYTLQVLSAHMKLLLDAPEHLWRLIERKKYLQAAWLFMLARVVHKSLIRNEEQDEQSWVNEGIDVSAEFPLVQRQWDVVSQFRSQIIHKSTLSLRETSSSSEDTCAILVTLHVLDSRPLNETLTAFLSQRSKALQSNLAWNPDASSIKNAPPSNIPNGHRPESDAPQSLPVREVTQVMKKALATIAQTIRSARKIFQDSPSGRSLIFRVLESIQEEEDARSPTQVKPLPDELRLSTRSLLVHLTSSANFQLLPPSLRFYKPYIDLNSTSTSLPHLDFSQRLEEWFRDSSNHWQRSAGRWFSGLQNIKDVWTLRTSIRKYVLGSGLDKLEKKHLLSNLVALCHERITLIWQKLLADTQSKFKSSLLENLSCPPANEAHLDDSPVDFLFQPPPIPVLSQTVKSFVDTPFQKYQLSLKRQLVGRSIQLDSVLSTLEHCARTIQQDLLHLRTNADDKTSPLIERLSETYQPAANDLSYKIASVIDEASTDVLCDAEGKTSGLVFLSRVTDNLASSSLFIENIDCNQRSAEEFKQSMSSINDKVIAKWCDVLVKRIAYQTKPRIKKFSPTAGQLGPSPEIQRALLSICDSIRQLGVVYHPVRQKNIVQDILRSFITRWTDNDANNGQLDPNDIVFLRKISDLYGQSWYDISTILADKSRSLVSDDTALTELEATVSEYLARTQTLFSSILPSPSPPIFDTPLLQFGVPSAGQHQQSAISLAKPSPRFGMLLVGNSGP